MAVAEAVASAVASVAAPAAVLAVRLVVGERVRRGLLRFVMEVVKVGRVVVSHCSPNHQSFCTPTPVQGGWIK